jgi:hypothetical protein
MSKTDEYRQFANDCIVWARIATSVDQRDQFLELAKRWMSDAESIDQGIELRPKEAAKASEMAGEEIDRLGDPLATDEERQLRKQRLIKGPQEFRDIRSNRRRLNRDSPDDSRMGSILNRVDDRREYDRPGDRAPENFDAARAQGPRNDGAPHRTSPHGCFRVQAFDGSPD